MLWHLETKHPSLNNKPEDFSPSLLNLKLWINQKDLITQTVSINREMPFKHLIRYPSELDSSGKGKTVPKKLIFPYITDIGFWFFGFLKTQDLRKISDWKACLLTNNTVLCYIRDPEEDAQEQLVSELTNINNYLAIQLDGSADACLHALIVFKVCFWWFYWTLALTNVQKQYLWYYNK